MKYLKGKSQRSHKEKNAMQNFRTFGFFSGRTRFCLQGPIALGPTFFVQIYDVQEKLP
jgi:hypothetical protein